MDAARALFEEVGFENTTVRMIAKRAGVSLGGVFTTFESKADILVAIVGERREAIIPEMERTVRSHTGTAIERIHASFIMGQREVFPDPKLQMAYLGASFGWGRNTEKTNAALQARMGVLMAEVLRDGIARGEVRADLDQLLFLKMTISLLVTNLRLAHYGDWTAEELEDVLRRQLEILFEGVRPRAVA